MAIHYMLSSFIYTHRTILLELTVLGVLVGTWYTQATSVFDVEHPTLPPVTPSSEPGNATEMESEVKKDFCVVC